MIHDAATAPDSSPPPPANLSDIIAASPSARPRQAGPAPTPGALLTQRLALWVLLTFIFTFVISRILVILIMSRTIPDLFFHLGQTHVHHLNYGIFLLSGVGGYLVFIRPVGGPLTYASAVYGVGLGLTFDEFGMWVHLGGSYWQRASFDAVVIVAALLGLVAFAPKLKRFKPQHWAVTAALAILVGLFAVLVTTSLRKAGRHYMPRLIEMEQRGPA